jgi:hypothetical protein
LAFAFVGCRFLLWRPGSTSVALRVVFLEARFVFGSDSLGLEADDDSAFEASRSHLANFGFGPAVSVDSVSRIHRWIVSTL